MFIFKPTEKHKEYVEKHAKLMCEGFHTWSFKNDEHQSLDVYYIGKMGELAVASFFKKNGINIEHKPFRESYDKMNFKDDFIVSKSGIPIQIEVRTKGRGVPPKPHYECCTDCIKPILTYIFVSYDKEEEVIHIVGWANWRNLREHARVTKAGTGNVNFDHKVNEFQIRIEDLFPMEDFNDAWLI